MRITAVETIQLSRGVTVHAGPIRWLWVRIHTDSGLIGLGETYPRPRTEAAVIHEALAPVLLGRDPGEIDRLWGDMFAAVSYSGWAGAEMRAISAVDIALWDLAGKVLGVPVYQLLGGAAREAIPTYNTCYDRIDFLTEPVRLARSLMADGIHAMKIWPFDPVARASGGQRLTPSELRQGLEPLRLIRQEVGDEMEVALEFHGYWSLPAAEQIARAAEPLAPMWLEEMLPQDNLAAYKELAAATRVPLCLSERLMTRWQYRELIENRAVRIAMPDLAWCGGFSEARRISDLASLFYVPVAPHNCGGPVLHFASLHFGAAVRNLHSVESVRRHYEEEYAGLVNGMVRPRNGAFPLPPGPGLGVELAQEVLDSSDALVERSPGS